MPGDSAVEHFLRDTCDAFATAARMLAAVGTRDFYHHAVELYGRPASLTADRKTTNLDLAEHFTQVVDGVAGRTAIPSPLDAVVPGQHPQHADRALRIQNLRRDVAQKLDGTRRERVPS